MSTWFQNSTLTPVPTSPMPNLQQGGRRVDVLLLVVAAVWGSSYLSAKVLVALGGVLAVLALRFLVAAAAMGLVLVVRRPHRPGRRELTVGVVLGSTQASVLVLETYGVSLTSATKAGVLISLTILLTPTLEGVLSRRWLPPRFFVAAVLALVGVGLLVAGPQGLAAPSSGDVLMLAAALVRAGHVTASGWLTRGRAFDTVTLTALQTVVGAVVFTAAAGPTLTLAAGSFGGKQWTGVLYLGLGCTVFAFLVQLWAVRRTSAARASLLLGTEPLWAVLVGVGLGGEHLTALAVAGGTLVLMGTFWGQRAETRHRTTGAAASSTPSTTGAPTSFTPTASATERRLK